MRRARAFPADVSLLFIETANEDQMIASLQQVNALLSRKKMDLGHRYQYEGSVISHLTENLSLANTAGGIDSALETTLRLARSFKHLQGPTS